MKREILFRGKSYGGKWLYGDLIHYGEDCFIFPISAVNIFERHRVDPDTVGQFTGKHDERGYKIFEDDLINIPHNAHVLEGIHQVHWWKDHFVTSWTKYSDFTNAGKWSLDFSIGVGGYVCGNIHDNPELLKGAQQ